MAVDDTAEVTFETLASMLAEAAAPSGAETAIAPLRVDALPAEVRTAMGLDPWPKDLQQELVAAFEKIARLVTAELVAARAGEAGAEAIGTAMRRTPNFGNRLSKAFVTMPSRDLVKDGLKGASRAMQLARGPLAPFRSAIGIGAFGATLIGGSMGHILGTVRRR